MDLPITPALTATEEYVRDFIQKNVGAEYVFHDISHTVEVVTSANEIMQGYDLNEREVEILLIAAWFHDTGYSSGGPDGHELRSCEIAKKFLSKFDFTKEELEILCGCIMATKMPHVTNSLLEEIIADSDMSHLGRKSYWDRCGRLRQELLMTNSMMMSEQEWIDFEIDFMTNHRFHTDFASELYDKRKHKHIRQLIKQKLRLTPTEFESMEALAKSDMDREKKKQKFKSKMSGSSDNALKELRLGRGVETMYRTTYRTHVSLSAIADNKANIMLSINAIIISIVISSLVPQMGELPQLIIPTLVLLFVCLVSMFYAFLATRPKVTEGKVTIEDIENKKGNLLFFGNFYKMPLKDYDWGVKEMIKDEDYLYGTMTRDIYYLGIVLAKKYKYLSHCYNIFMFGLIITVICFAVTFLI